MGTLETESKLIMNKIALRLAIISVTFFIGIIITVAWIFSRDIPQLPPLNRDKLTIEDSKSWAEEKIEREYEKTRLEDFKKFKKHLNNEFLTKFKEKSFEKLSKSVDENYRFIWIPSFHSPVLIRVLKTGDKRFLIAKTASGEGFNIGKISMEKTVNLTEEQWNNFLKLLDDASFWNNPTLDKDDEPVTDGAVYIFEGNKNKKFHEIHRATPSKEFRELGGYLINLTELKTEYENY